jgi:peptidyl-prolyl cis-trans isomerase B (cyclophilin B)
MNFALTSTLRRGLLLVIASVALQAYAQPAAAADASTLPRVKLSTNMGDIVLELNPAKAPKTVANFLNYVKSGHYSGTVFHRVIPGFMIQGGGMDGNLREKATQAPIENEASNGLKNDRYTIAMARTSNPNSASAQFFINVANNDFLNHTAPTLQGWGYAVFGKVIQGAEVVDKIAAVRTNNAGRYQDVPQSPIIINAATVLP